MKYFFIFWFLSIIFFGCVKDQNPVEPTPIPSSITYEGKTYNIVKIGKQVWLKENLDVGIQIISTTAADSQSNNGVIEKYCYENNPANCEKYGGLYQWDEAMQYITAEGAQGICPVGWHIPTLAEFNRLADTVGNNSNILKALGEGTGGGTGTDTSGFSALLAGYRYNNSTFHYMGYEASFWSSMQFSDASAVNLTLYYNDSDIYYSYHSKNYGFSVRCIKD